MAKALDLTGKRFGKLLVVSRAENNKNGNTMWNCICDCGSTKVALGYDLTHGRTTSCGCGLGRPGVASGKRINLTGKRFGHLTVLGLDDEKSKNGILVWRCQCDCGNTVAVRGGNLKSGNVKSCGCNNYRKTTQKDLTGRKFGRLTVIEKSGKKDNRITWRCKCECGKEKIVPGAYLISGRTKSCGCLYAENRKKPKRITHGKTKTRIYREYRSMIVRCTQNYHNKDAYYSRGISVCQEWNEKEVGFMRFFEWAINNGYSDDLTLDRIDVNGNYSPENCRWVTMKVQQNNRRDNIMIEYNGKTQTMKQWCEELGLNYGMVRARKQRGWEVPELFSPKKKNQYC